ncbi:conserved hypothetical protein [delta proteobacterium NaphS2]|nr:conserved hypothetical protein [delta proteobacterium NaphS2]
MFPFNRFSRFRFTLATSFPRKTGTYLNLWVLRKPERRILWMKDSSSCEMSITRMTS